MKTFRVGTTTVVVAQIASELDEVVNLLTDTELSELRALTSGRRCLERATTIAVLRNLMGPAVSLMHDPDGSPILNGRHEYISISHSLKDVAVAIDPERRAGIDTETWREQLSRVAGKYLSETERKEYCTPELLLRAWTVKEAVYKAAKTPGLALVGGIALPPVADDNPVAVATLPDGTIRRFKLVFIPSPHGIATTLALPSD